MCIPGQFELGSMALEMYERPSVDAEVTSGTILGTSRISRISSRNAGVSRFKRTSSSLTGVLQEMMEGARRRDECVLVSSSDVEEKSMASVGEVTKPMTSSGSR